MWVDFSDTPPKCVASFHNWNLNLKLNEEIHHCSFETGSILPYYFLLDSFGCFKRNPPLRKFIKSSLRVFSGNGTSPKENISHITTPKAQTSDFSEKRKSVSDSIASQRNGMRASYKQNHSQFFVVFILIKLRSTSFHLIFFLILAILIQAAS